MVFSLPFKIALFAVLFVLTIFLVIQFREKPFVKDSKPKACAMLAVLLLITFAIRMLYIRDVETDVDTSTWLSAVIAFDHYPAKLWTLLNYSDSRPLTVLPLIAGTWLGLPVGYASSEIIGLLCWITIIYILYRIACIFISRNASLLFVWSLCLFTSTIWVGFASYNSEHISVLMIAVALASYIAYVYRKWESGSIALATGILLGSFVYAKFQNVPMGLLIGVFLLLEMLMQRKWKVGLLLLAGSLLPTVLINIYFASSGQLDVFWNNYFWNYFYYSFTDQFSKTSQSERFALFRATVFIFYATNTGVYFLALSGITLAGLLIRFRSMRKEPPRESRLILFSLLFLLLSLYAVMQSGNNFQHYKLYLVVPLLLAAILVFARQNADIQRYTLIFLMIGSLFQTVVNIHYLSETKTIAENDQKDEKVLRSIRRHTKVSDPIVVWGWRDALFVLANRPMGYRDAHVFHFSLRSPLLPNWTRDFIHDMEQNKPKLFIDAMIPIYSERGHLFRSHDEVPAIYRYVKSRYTLIENLDGVKIFKRKI